jgi:hypothetical protein
MLSRAERQRWHRGDQIRPQPHLRHILGPVMIGRHHCVPDRVHLLDQFYVRYSSRILSIFMGVSEGLS